MKSIGARWIPLGCSRRMRSRRSGNGHPGTAMSLAPAAYLLYQRVMQPRSGGHALGRPRPVHPVGRPLVADAVRAAVSRRLRSGARRPEVAAHVGLAEPPVTPSTVTPTASRSPPARSARVWPRRSGSRTRRATSAACSIRMPLPDRARSTTASTSSRPTATCRRASPVRRPRSRGTRSWATSS